MQGEQGAVFAPGCTHVTRKTWASPRPLSPGPGPSHGRRFGRRGRRPTSKPRVGRASSRILGYRMARTIEACWQLKGCAGSRDPMVRMYLPIAVATCPSCSAGWRDTHAGAPATVHPLPPSHQHGHHTSQHGRFRHILSPIGRACPFGHSRKGQGVGGSRQVGDEVAGHAGTRNGHVALPCPQCNRILLHACPAPWAAFHPGAPAFAWQESARGGVALSREAAGRHGSVEMRMPRAPAAGRRAAPPPESRGRGKMQRRRAARAAALNAGNAHRREVVAGEGRAGRRPLAEMRGGEGEQ